MALSIVLRNCSSLFVAKSHGKTRLLIDAHCSAVGYMCAILHVHYIPKTQGCALVGDPARAIGDCMDPAQAQL